MKTVVHIIPHAHWDREWYLPLEWHRARLLSHLDAVLALLEQDPAYTYHMDGQMIAVEDYLRFRPEREADIRRFCQEGRLHLGPWYVLQDEYLTSGEANVRNLMLGMTMAARFGPVCRIGYLPDAFGNVGQMPQLFRQAGLEAAVFGRGVTLSETAPDPDAHCVRHSEFMWQSPDGSEVPAIFFAGWYNNAQEIPAEPDAARVYWDARLAHARRFASTGHLLFMNGSDHQPVQKDLAQALDTARALYPDIEFVCSDFEHFLACVRADRETCPETVCGEMCGQESAGDNTLCNTASSRAQIKALNRRAESLLALTAEPLLAMARLAGGAYDPALLHEAWRLLMENHPHDSICGCGIDAVHRETVARYEKSLQLGELLTAQAADTMAAHVSAPVDTEAAFVILNPSPWPRKEPVTVTVGTGRRYGSREAYTALEQESPGTWTVVGPDGQPCMADVEDIGIGFGYELPDDRFRQPYFEHRFRVTVTADLPAFGFSVYGLRRGTPCAGTGLCSGERAMENRHVAVSIHSNGTFDLEVRHSGRVYRGLGLYEDAGDVGDEYIFRETSDGRVTSAHETAEITCTENTQQRTSFRVVLNLTLPAGADATLEHAQKSMEPRLQRNIHRGTEYVTVPVKMTLSLTPDSPLLSIRVRVQNRARDHRLRILFPTGTDTHTHLVDSVFDVLERPDVPGPNWTNPSRCQRMQYFAAVQDGKAGLAVLNRGAYEYEILDEAHTVAVTLLRCVGEMGDWGVFPTPDAQCQGEYEMTLGLLPYQDDGFRESGCRAAIQFQTDPVSRQLRTTDAMLGTSGSFLESSGPVAVTACKPAEDGNGMILRGVCTTQAGGTWMLQGPGVQHAHLSDILEHEGEVLPGSGSVTVPVRAREIRTVRIESC